MNEATNLLLQTVPLFARLSKHHLALLLSYLRLAEFKPGEIIFEEGSRSSGRIYVVLDGMAAALKKGRSPIDNRLVDYEVAVHGRNDVLGALSLLDGEPLDFSVRAKTPLKVAILDFTAVASKPARRLKRIVVAEVRRYLLRNMRASFTRRVETLRREAEDLQHRHAVGHSLTAALALLSFYTLALSLLPGLQHAVRMNFIISPLIILVFALIFLPVILLSGFPPQFLGLRIDNWRCALRVGLQATAVFVTLMVACKWLLIISVPELAGAPLISFADIEAGHGTVQTGGGWFWAAFLVYVMLTPLQEFVARCGVQAPLYAFLPGSQLKRQAWSIGVSSLVFAAAHVHIGLAFAIAAFIPGMFWGWLFARTNSLLAVAISHILIGGAGVFLFGVEEFVQKLIH
jgi:CRP-like cAMP-binding protein